MIRKEKLKELKKYIEELKTINLSEISKNNNSFISSKTYECFLNNGKTIIREQILKNKKDGSAVVILPITSENDVILIVEPRVFSKTTVGISIPAGYIESDESSSQAALRELKEEVGYTSENLISLGGFYQDNGCSKAFNEIFLALNCKKISNQNLDDGEYIRYFKCSYDEALELIEANYIQDCNALITFYKSKSYMKG